MLQLARALLITLTAVCASSVQPSSAQAPALLGSNLHEVNDYSPQVPFLNIFRFSREWLTQCRTGVDPGCTNQNAFDTGEQASLDLDEAGWIKSLPAPASTPIFTHAATVWDLPAGFPSGRYVVLYQGSGTIEFELGAQKLQSLSAAGREIIEIDISNGPILLRITSTDPSNTGNYIRNIRIIPVEQESLADSQLFSDHFLRQIQPYQVLRFMDWMRTNNSTLSVWGSRALPSDARYSTDKGVPIEIMIELANTTGKSPWFNIPHQASDDFIQKFALLTKESLASNLTVYVEYSNEIWNSLFQQGSFVEQRGQQQWPASAESGFTKRINYYGKRSAEICRIWKDTFAQDPSRVVCVIASQAANSWTADEALRCPLWVDGPCVAHGVSALAIAPYFGDYLGQEQSAAEISAWSGSLQTRLTRLFNELQKGSEVSSGPSSGALGQSFQWISDNLSVANTHSVELVTYEGGQHLVGVGTAQNDSGLSELFTTANRDRRMYELYQTYLAGWKARGGGLFMHFSDIGSYSKFGSWGALETPGQSSSPKYDALREYSPNPGSDTPGSGSGQVSLRVRRSSGGVVRGDSGAISCGRKCATSVSRNSQLTVTAKPQRGFRFKRWAGACRTSSPKCTIVMDRNRSVRAVFHRR
jgi:hypothetical protein